jgi:hypothetical protein
MPPPSTLRLPTTMSNPVILQRRQHPRQQALVMLEVSVHDRNIGRARGKHPLDTRRREPAAMNSMQDAHPTVCRRKRSNRLRRPVRRIVVDEDYLPANTSETLP